MPDGSSFTPAPSLEIAKGFWTLYSGDGDSPIRLIFLPAVPNLPKKERQQYHDAPYNPPAEIEGTLAELWPAVIAHQERGYSVYFFANATEAGLNRPVNDADVTSIRSLHIDCDTGLPKSWHVRPDLVVATSKVGNAWDGEIQKGAAYWLVDDMPLDAFQEAQQRLIQLYGSDKQVNDKKRVMRLPGTLHRKPSVSRDEVKLLQRQGQPVPLTAPQLVTFTDNTEGGGRDFKKTSAEIMAGVPELNSGADRKDSKTATHAGGERTERRYTGEPKKLWDIEHALSYINPCIGRDDWKDIVRGIAGTPIMGETPENAAENEREKLHLGFDFIRGAVYRATLSAAERKHLRGVFRDEGEVERLFRHKNSGYSFATIAMHAKRAGWPGELPEEVGKSENRRIDMLTVGEMFALPKPKPLIAHLLMEGEDMAIVGTPKSSKTYVAIDMGMAVATGRPAFGRFEVLRTGYVVYLSGEGHSFFPQRLRAWGIHNDYTEADLERVQFVYNRGVPLAAGGTKEALEFIDAIRRKTGEEPALVFIDTMSRSLGAEDENSTVAANQYLTITAEIRRELNCTTVTLAHASNKKGAALDFRGTSAFAGGFDSAVTTEINKANMTVTMRGLYFKERSVEKFGALQFRAKEIRVDDDPDQPIVLEHVQYDRNNDPRYVKEQEQAKEAAAEKTFRGQVEKALREHGAVGEEKGITTRELAELLVPKKKAPHDSNGAKKARLERETEINKTVNRLKQGRTRINKSLGRPTLQGLSEDVAVPKDKNVPRGGDFQPGSTRNELLWFLADDWSYMQPEEEEGVGKDWAAW